MGEHTGADQVRTTDPGVVVGIDGSAGSRDAVLVAARSARRRGVRLQAVVVLDPPVWTEGWSTAAAADFPLAPASELTSRTGEMARGMVGDVLDQLRREDGDVPSSEVVVLTGDPAVALLDAARDADELVVGHRGLGGIASILLGSVGRSTVLHAHCPVTVVPAGVAPSRHAAVVVGVDGSECSRSALAHALREAVRRSTTVTAVVVHQAEVVTWPAAGDVLPLVQDLARRELERARAFVDGTVAALVDAGEGVPPVTVKGVTGSPAAVLNDAARDAALLVVGHRGRGAIRSTLFGSTALRCVLQATSPVTVVPQPGREPVGPADRASTAGSV